MYVYICIYTYSKYDDITIEELRGKIHTRNHTSEIPLENAIDNPLDNSRDNPLEK